MFWKIHEHYEEMKRFGNRSTRIGIAFDFIYGLHGMIGIQFCSNCKLVSILVHKIARIQCNGTDV